MVVHFAVPEKGGKVLRYDEARAALLGQVGLGPGGVVNERTSSLHLTAMGRVVRHFPLTKQYTLVLDDSLVVSLLLDSEGQPGTQLTKAGEEWLAARRHMVEEA